jgi:hypothetical protein
MSKSNRKTNNNMNKKSIKQEPVYVNKFELLNDEDYFEEEPDKVVEAYTPEPPVKTQSYEKAPPDTKQETTQYRESETKQQVEKYEFKFKENQPSKYEFRDKEDKWNSSFQKKKKNNIPETAKEDKVLYIKNTFDSEKDIGNLSFLNAQWNVWSHSHECQTWTEESYKNIYMIDSIGSFWRFFNNFHLIDKVSNQLFIMRNQIKPIWEDNENKKGGICSIKIDCPSRQGRVDTGSIIMTICCFLVMNETFIPSNNEINGISYSIKNRSVLIKLWTKNGSNNIINKLPITLLDKISQYIKNNERSNFNNKNENKISLRFMQIQPEYEV